MRRWTIRIGIAGICAAWPSAAMAAETASTATDESASVISGSASARAAALGFVEAPPPESHASRLFDATPEARPVEDEGKRPSLHARFEAGIGSTYVSRGRAQYQEKTDASAETWSSLSVNDLGPGALSLSVSTMNAMAHTDATSNVMRIRPGLTYTVDPTTWLETRVGYFAYLKPQVTPVDTKHEAYGYVAIKSSVVTPFVGTYLEFVRKHGEYTFAGLTRDFKSGDFTVTPTAQIAVAGYRDTAFHLNDVTTSVRTKWSFSRDFFASATVAYAYLASPKSQLGTVADTFAGRSTPWGLLTVGADL